MKKSSLVKGHGFDRKRAIDLVMQLMGISGKSGHEGQVVEFIKRHLRKIGIADAAIQSDSAHRKTRLGGEVGNLILRLPGTVRQPRRLLMAHIDTVPLCVGSEPVRRGDFVHSRDPQTALGGDDRAGAAVILNAVTEIVKNRLPHPPLTILWPVQEEVGLLGVRHVALSKLGKPKLCFNWDGGAPNVAVIGATGDYNIEIDIHGVASHAGGHPEAGVSAIAIASFAIADLAENGWHGLIVKGRNRGTSNVGVISGGEATNVVTPHVRIRAEARSHDPQFRKRIVREIELAFKRATRRVTNSRDQRGSIDFRAELKYESFQLSPEEPSVKTALAAVQTAGLTPDTQICNGGLDANWMTARGFPAVTLGCGQQDIHTVNEVLHIKSFLHACEIALLLATGTV